jgi:hypothetical protein
MEVVIYANYIGLCRFYQYVVNIGRWSPYECGKLDRFHYIYIKCLLEFIFYFSLFVSKQNSITIFRFIHKHFS